LLPPDQAPRPYSAAEQASLDSLRANAIVGDAQQVRTKLEALAGRLEVDELVIITWTHDASAQRRSYELLAQAFSLSPTAS
jgi:alkanesulfonate monooxygenase SsuD/methylene tetrahydromethanopterin reductase-like flavin-dependent oxidoreductase (luciferase family)